MALLAALTLALFWPATGYKLVNLNDLVYVKDNQLVLEGLNWAAIREAFTSLHQTMWAPGLWLSYMLDIKLYGMTTWGLHFTNILLHTVNTLLAFGLFWSWTRKPWHTFWAAAIWAWHPLRVESVAWVSARKDVLSGLFFLMCLLFYYVAHRAPPSRSQTARTWPRRLWLTASLLSMALGLTVKPMLVTTPVVLLLLDIWPLRRAQLTFRDLLRKLPRLIVEKWLYWIAVVASAFMTIYAHAQGTSLGNAPLSMCLMGIPLNYVFYLLKTALPIRLTILYPNLAVQPITVLLSFLTLLLLTLWVWDYRRQSLASLIGWLWFLGVMLPTSGIIRFGVQSLADRFMYLPAFGLSILVLPLFPTRGSRLRGIRVILCTSVLLGLALLTHRQLPVWRDSEHLFDQLLRYSPDHAYALSEKASQMTRLGRLQEAEELIRRACREPTCTDSQQIMLAEILASRGKTEQAKAHLLSQTLKNPGISSGYWHFALAMVLNQMEDYPEALRHTQQAAQALEPQDLLYRDLLLLGLTISYRMDAPQDALQWARRLPRLSNATRVRFGDLMPYYLGQWKRQQRPEAVAYFREYLAQNPDQPDALNNLAWLMATAEWSPMPAQEIVTYARRVNELVPSNPILLDTLGVALAHAGEFTAAQDAARQAQDILRATNQEQSILFQQITRRMEKYTNHSPWREENAADRILNDYYEH
ncbi:MAG: tetratricopeptide repeat protein [Kiritimatiellae bacterium]|nr:tetratricopeptide repeat protein [Kiritimatiellia bacterium]